MPFKKHADRFEYVRMQRGDWRWFQTTVQFYVMYSCITYN